MCLKPNTSCIRSVCFSQLILRTFRRLAQIVTCTGTGDSLPNACKVITENQRHLSKLVASKTNIRSPVFWDCRWGKLRQEPGHPRRMPLDGFTFFLSGIMNQTWLNSTLKTKGIEENGLHLLSPHPAIAGADHSITSTKQCTHQVTGTGTEAAK